MMSFQRFLYEIIIIINILYISSFLKTLIPFYNLISYLFTDIAKITLKHK